MSKRFLIWFWSQGGGGSAFALYLAQRLARDFGADGVRLSLRGDDPIIWRARGLCCDVLAADIVSDRKRPLTTIAQLARGREIIQAHTRDVDAVIVAMNFAMAAPLALQLKQKLVYCAHDPEPHPGDYAQNLQRVTQSMLVARAARVVALSNYAASRLRAPAHRIVVAPLASVFPPRAAAPPAPVDGPARLLFAGRMLAYKGLDLLAEALDTLAGRGDWRLSVAGHGPALDAEMIARLRRPQLEALSRDWLDDDALEQLIEGCDVLVAPYRSATQSGIVAQAMAMGKPCVVTPVGALPEQVGEGGWVASSASAAAFAEALREALAGDRAAKSRAALSAARAAWEGDHWSWLSAL